MTDHDAAYYEDDRQWGDHAIVNVDQLALRLETTRRMLPRSVASLVDVGAGDGRVIEHLLDHADGPAFAVAVDRSFAALRHVDTRRVRASGDQLPFADRSFSVAMACEVLEHLPPPTFDAMRAELARVAADHVFISVPFRENRRRSDVVCQQCGCRYNSMRHLRSFDRPDLVDLIPGFRLVAAEESGHRAPLYPRVLRTALERRGLLNRAWSPTCPLCSTVYDPRANPEPRRSPAAPPDAAPREAVPVPVPERDDHDGGGSADGARRALATYRLAQRAIPRARHRYWICALYQRSGASPLS